MRVVPIIVMLGLLVALPHAGAGPLAVTPTSFEVEGEGAQSDPSIGLEPGDRGYIFAFVTYCFGGGPGLNLDGELEVSVQISGAPAWVMIDGGPQHRSFAPDSLHIGQSEVCERSYAEFLVEITTDAPTGASGVINITVDAVERGDMGTYHSVEGQYEVQVPIAVAE